MKETKNQSRNFFSISRCRGLIIFLFLSLGIFAVGNFALADSAVVGYLFDGLSSLVSAIVNLLGYILTAILWLLLKVASYNNFINSGAVTHGWVIVRDLCNMFFILILLVIAFATILRVEGYDLRRMLPKLIIMAVLINFSKTICGIIIDFSQLIMNAFISVFNVGGQAMTNMMGLNDLMTFVKNNPDTKVADHARIFGAYIFALIYMLIAVIVVFVLLAVLVVRIVMLWIYIVLSPLAYFLATFPQGGKYVSQWWDDFTKNVIVGPVLAFFLWLSFVSLGNGNVGTEVLQQSGAQSIFSDAAPTGGLT
ncbi:MAG TPA: hypothetical protein VMD74_00730, partial [Candidatus Methylomirabilis sp.]|nr:hypothetical protein [Candidatus Methylomirabilis sp.]